MASKLTAQEMAHLQTQLMAIFLALSSLYLAYTVYAYGYKRVWLLQIKTFHATMFWLAVAIGLGYITTFALATTLYSKTAWTGTASAERLVIATTFFDILSFPLSAVLHLLVVMKIWVISKKLEDARK
jgi:hypothetical protein